MVYFKKIYSFRVRDASLLVTVSSIQCLDMTVTKIENGLERGFVKHRPNCLLIADPMCSVTRIAKLEGEIHFLVTSLLKCQ